MADAHDTFDCLACGSRMDARDTCPACGWSYAEGDEPPPDLAPESEEQSDESAVPRPQSPSRSALWWEVGAVLAVGVIPHLYNAVVDVGRSRVPPPFWYDAATLIVTSACSCYVVLYLMHRSGEPWSAFGLPRPKAVDVATGFGLMLASVALAYALYSLARPRFESKDDYFPRPQAAWEYGLLVVMYGFSAFSEELVCRAYLVTRLEQLRGSATQAVLIAGVIFASYHVYQGTIGFVNALFFGLLFGAIFVVTRRLWPLAVAHALVDIYYSI
jgi:membrane protease YdiL (CAAX protease family)